MAGNMLGGKKSAATNIRKYGEDYYSRVGALGGLKRVSKGFGTNKELAHKAGRRGGMVSKRGHKFIGFDERGEPQYLIER